MNDAPPPQDAPAAGRDRPAARTLSPRVLLVFGLLLLVAFGAGFLWQYLEAREARSERDELQRELVFQEMATSLATAVVQAGNEGYEPAREMMSRFFTTLQDRVEEAPTEAQPELRELLARRDAVITALSRSDPDSREILTRLYTRYQVVMGGSALGISIPPPGEGEAPGGEDPAGASDPPGTGDGTGADPTGAAGGGSGGS